VSHARNADELLEVLGDELWSVIGNDPRFNAGLPLFGSFQNDLNVGLRHLLAQIPMNQETAVAVQDAAQVVERRTNVQVGNIDMPMLVRLRWLGTNPCRDAQRQQNPKLGTVPKPSRGFLMQRKKASRLLPAKLLWPRRHESLSVVRIRNLRVLGLPNQVLAS
jgi:hypothetical protein